MCSKIPGHFLWSGIFSNYKRTFVGNGRRGELDEETIKAFIGKDCFSCDCRFATGDLDYFCSSRIEESFSVYRFPD